jgi:DNA-directed RNA polymerase
MDLYKKQCEYQTLEYRKENELEFLKKYRLDGWPFDTLRKAILEYKKEHLYEVVNKIIKEHNKDFLKILKTDLKNIEDRIAKPLTYFLIEDIEYDNTKYNPYLEEIRNSAKKLKNITPEQFIRIYNHLKILLKEKKEKFDIDDLREKQWIVALLFFDIKASLLAKIILTNAIKLVQVSLDEEDYRNSFQEISTDIFKSFTEDELLKTKIDFDTIKNEYIQKIGGEFLDLLVKYEILEESNENKEKNYIFYRISNKLVKKLKNKLNKFAMKTVFKPMIVPPKDWKNVREGGFLECKNQEIKDKSIIIKIPKENLIIAKTPKEKHKMKEKKIPQPILDAINYLQKIPYQINKDTLNLITEIRNNLKTERGIIDYEYYKIFFELLNEFKVIRKNNLKEIEIHINLQQDEYFQEKMLKKRKITQTFKNKVKKIAKDVFKNMDNKAYLNKLKIEKELAKHYYSLDLILDIAKEFSQYEKIYFIWRMDFRGRLYPLQTLLHPQGDDIIKSLLNFAEKKEVNEKWFKIHGANLFGKDKETYENRIKWFDENEDKILSVEKGSDFWMEADEPYQFYAFCLEYARYKKDKNYKSSLIVSIDGSNNGLQHISTMLKDKESAKRVNVLPTDKVEDIYMDVLKVFKEKLNVNLDKEKYIVEKIKDYEILFKEIEKEEYTFCEIYDKLIKFLTTEKNENYIEIFLSNLEADKKYKKELKKHLNEINKEAKELVKQHKGKINFLKSLISIINSKKIECEIEIENYINKNGIIKQIKKEKKPEYKSLYKYIIDKIDRKFIKKPVMIDSYGASKEGKAEKIKPFLEKFLPRLDEEYINGFASHLASLIEESINEVVKSADVYEKFMKFIVKKIIKTNPKYVEWKTPLGFIVSQVEFETKEGRIKFDNRIIKYIEETDKISEKEHKKGIAPNFIHSMDATHLYRVINRLKEENISIRPIHDSFGVHSCDVDRLQTILKEEFIKIYNENVLKNFVKDIKNRYNLSEDFLNDLDKFLKKLKKKKQINIDEYVPYFDDDFDLKEILKSKYMFS